MKGFGVLLLASALFSQPQALSEPVFEIRDPSTDAAHFRKALEKIGETLAMDFLEELHTEEVAIQTLTGAEAKHALVDEEPVLAAILRAGLPLLVISAIASKPGIDRITAYNPNIKIFAAAIDPSLNDNGYIIPGLGDAGDRSFGMKSE